MGWFLQTRRVRPRGITRLRNVGTPPAEFCADIQKVADESSAQTHDREAFSLPDLIAMAVVLDPEVVTAARRCFPAVEMGKRGAETGR